MEKKKPTRNRYTDEFRKEGVALVTEQGYSVIRSCPIAWIVRTTALPLGINGVRPF